MTEQHEFVPMDVNSQLCKICNGTPNNKLHKKARTAEVKPTPTADKKV